MENATLLLASDSSFSFNQLLTKAILGRIIELFSCGSFDFKSFGLDGLKVSTKDKNGGILEVKVIILFQNVKIFIENGQKTLSLFYSLKGTSKEKLKQSVKTNGDLEKECLLPRNIASIVKVLQEWKYSNEASILPAILPMDILIKNKGIIHLLIDFLSKKDAIVFLSCCRLLREETLKDALFFKRVYEFKYGATGMSEKANLLWMKVFFNKRGY